MQEASAISNGEEWRPVVGYESYYEVSSLGRVRRSVDGLRRGIKAGYILKQRPTAQGYPFVGLYDRDTKITRSTLVHNIVTAGFLGPKPLGMQVNHIDGNKLNAAIQALRGCSANRTVHSSPHLLVHG
jgi:hypothetical protein